MTLKEEKIEITVTFDFQNNKKYISGNSRDTRSNRLYSYIVNNSIDVLAPPTHTRFGISSSSMMDYALIKNLNWPCTINSIPELSSDHNPIKRHFPRTSRLELTLPTQLNTAWSIFTKNLAKTKISIFFRPAPPMR
ncbi:hypothetical protein TNCV_989621 [Trichonephila clavipes]|nr:hypothetical protein TNCV_989621 [Trichonephila clavipes]